MGHHPGEIGIQTANSGSSMSPLAWMIAIAILVVLVYFIYWLFNRDTAK